jgi:hypothetical protein
MAAKEISVNVTEFKSRCLEHLRKLEAGTLDRMTILRRGKPVAIVQRPVEHEKPLNDVYGFMRDVMHLAPHYDPFDQVLEEPRDASFDTPTDDDAAA